MNQDQMLRRARRLEWATLAYLAVDVALIAAVMGTSQAMQAALVQDALALIPPIAFLIGLRITRRSPSRQHPYGYHRAIGISHLIAAMALFAFGALLLIQSAISLFAGERPSIGGISILGHTIWAGWLMIAVMVAGGLPPLVLGRLKLKLAEPLHNRVLYADAQMNKADWLSSAATILGVLGTGVGLWWTDAVAAIVISADILFDGLKNLCATPPERSSTHAPPPSTTRPRTPAGRRRRLPGRSGLGGHGRMPDPRRKAGLPRGSLRDPHHAPGRHPAAAAAGTSRMHPPGPENPRRRPRSRDRTAPDGPPEAAEKNSDDH